MGYLFYLQNKKFYTINMRIYNVSSIKFRMNEGPVGSKDASECEFLVTPSFESHMIDLVRAVSSSELPILLEGY